jgi:uncharacterized protein (TIGR02118 family)
MVLISVMYPGGAGATFDQDYYLKTHIPLVKERWTSLGLEKVQVVRAAATPDGSPPPYPMMALLSFRSAADFQTAAATHGTEIFADIPRFSNVSPIVQINDIVG